MVQLKAIKTYNKGSDNGKFQFLMVQLKDNWQSVRMIIKDISIPNGSIKSKVKQGVWSDISIFQFLMVQLKEVVPCFLFNLIS